MATALVVSLLLHADGKDAKPVSEFALSRIHKSVSLAVKTTDLVSVIFENWYLSFGCRKLGSQRSPFN